MSFHVPDIPFVEAGPIFAILVATILLGPLVAKRLRIPQVVVIVLLGFAVGPTGFGLIERAGAVATLGSAGLLYLMFVAGLELDLDGFVEQRNRSMLFGTALFVFPMVIGTAVSLWLGFPVLAALLIASTWSSHTLLTYPIFQVAGTVGNRAVTTTVGATIVTDTTALLVLAVVARAHQGDLGVLFWVTLIPSALALTTFAALVLPRLTRRFFSGPGQDHTVRFAFVLAAMFIIASLFDLIGIEAIVGAFVAGLALNRSVPNSGLLMERIEFLGQTLFIPLFLIATGMLIDISVLTDRRTLLLGAAFIGIAMGGRALATFVSGRAFRWERVEIAAMFALSAPQAAATLAAMVVGLDVGLIETETVNAAMIVILVSSLLASALSSNVAPRLTRPGARRSHGEVVVVPVANPATAPGLMRLASSFARADGGLVVPLLVSPYGSHEELERMRGLEEDVVAVAQSAGAEARSVLRIDATAEDGIVHTVREQVGSLLVLGWKGSTTTLDSLFGGVTDQVITRTDVPVLLRLENREPPTRILLVIDESVAFTDPSGPLALALVTAKHLSRELGLPIEALSNTNGPAVVDAVEEAIDAPLTIDGRRRSIIVRSAARSSDLLILPALRSEAHLRAVSSRLVRATPRGAGMVVTIGNAATRDNGRLAQTEQRVALQP